MKNKFQIYDNRGPYFSDNRKCYWCTNFIRIDEEYDFIYTTDDDTAIKVYFCEKCLANNEEVSNNK